MRDYTVEITGETVEGDRVTETLQVADGKEVRTHYAYRSFTMRFAGRAGPDVPVKFGDELPQLPKKG